MAQAIGLLSRNAKNGRSAGSLRFRNGLGILAIIGQMHKPAPLRPQADVCNFGPSGLGCSREQDCRRNAFHSGLDVWQAVTVECPNLVEPVKRLDELAGDWPEEDSVDEFLALVRQAIVVESLLEGR
jgi:hypothetical protein